MRHAHLQVVRIVTDEARGDLLRRPVIPEPTFHFTAQPRMGRQLCRLGPSRPPGGRLFGPPSTIVIPRAVPGYLTRDRRNGSAQPRGDAAQRVTGDHSPRELLSVSQRQPQWRALSRPRHHTSGSSLEPLDGLGRAPDRRRGSREGLALADPPPDLLVIGLA